MKPTRAKKENRTYLRQNIQEKPTHFSSDLKDEKKKKKNLTI